MEKLLISSEGASRIVGPLVKALFSARVTIHASPEVLALIPADLAAANGDLIKKATPESFETEYLDLSCSVMLVSSLEEGISHINKYGSHHTGISLLTTRLIRRHND